MGVRKKNAREIRNINEIGEATHICDITSFHNITPPTDPTVTTLKQLPEDQADMHVDVNEIGALLNVMPSQPRGQLGGGARDLRENATRALFVENMFRKEVPGKLSDDKAQATTYRGESECHCDIIEKPSEEQVRAASTEAPLKRHSNQSSSRLRHKHVEVNLNDSEIEVEDALPEEAPRPVVVPRSEQARLCDCKEEMLQMVAKSRDLDVPNQTNSEEHLAKAKRWLERNKAERLEKKSKVDSRPRLPDIQNQTEPEENLTAAKRWFEQNKAERLEKKKASPPIILKLDELVSHASLKRTIDDEVDKFGKYWEALRNRREFQSILRKAISSSLTNIKRGEREEPANIQVSWKVGKEVWILGIEGMYGSTMLRFN